MFLRLSLFLIMLMAASAKAYTVQTVTDGDWENAACWSNSQVPTNPDTILVLHYVVLHQALTIQSPTVLFIGATGTICGDYLLETVCGASFINYGHLYLNQIKTRAGTNYNVIQCKNNMTISGCTSPTAGFHSVPPNGSVSVWPPVFCKTPDTNWEGGTSLGLRGETAHALFKVYPNPVSGGPLTIITNSHTGVRLTDALGREVIVAAFENNIQLFVEDLPAGVYFLELETNGRKTVRKVLRL